MTSSGVGAYGFILNGLADAHAWLNRAPDSWPPVDVTQEIGEPADRTRVGEESAEVVLPGRRSIVVRREPAAVRFIGDDELQPELLVHPYLAPAASVLAQWQGWVPLHAGAFVVDGGAWLVLGERGSGKSTTLAALSAAGFPVLADDLTVLRDNLVLAGPRSVDLRDERGYSSTDLGKVGERHRWRVRLPDVALETPVAGAVQLSWSDKPGLRRLTAPERSQALGSALSMSVDGQLFLQTMAIPVHSLSRPHGHVEDTIGLLREVTE